MDTAPLNALSPMSFPPHESDPNEHDWVDRPAPDSGGSWRRRPDGPRRPAALAAKRVIDLTGAAAGLVLLAPFLMVIAALIRLDSPGPVFFRQRRIGRHGRSFWIFKFRTMRADAEQRLAELEARNEAARGVLFKMRDDPRVTRLGKFLRRTNLDELPQLLNVLRGDMSLVGPRPFQMRDSERLRALDPDAFDRRLKLRPGVTGAWQVGRRSPTDSERLLELDLDYVENWSLALDLSLIYRTFFVILLGLLDRETRPATARPVRDLQIEPHAGKAAEPV
jgi:lipopolysaccharide/colanic/teichoic acid biosynthesis glycosyltransferase